jgi:toxin ParE1/3/4
LKYVLSPKAQSDREARWHYLCQFDEDVADRVDVEIRSCLRLLTTQPYLGTATGSEGIRKFLLGHTRMVALYRVERDQIWVVRLLHGAQDWPARF